MVRSINETRRRDEVCRKAAARQIAMLEMKQRDATLAERRRAAAFSKADEVARRESKLAELAAAARPEAAAAARRDTSRLTRPTAAAKARSDEVVMPSVAKGTWGDVGNGGRRATPAWRQGL